MNTLTKWGIGTLVVAGAVAAALIPRERAGYRGYGFGDSRSARRDSLYTAWTTERQKYRVAYQVVERGQARADAEAANAGLTPRLDAPVFKLDPALTEATRQRIVQLATSELRGSQSLPLRYPITVVATYDSTMRGPAYSQAVVLPRRPGEPCTVALRVPSTQRNNFGATATQRLLATCAFYAAYGAPGAGTEKWLVETRGISARFLVPPSALVDDTARFRVGVQYTAWNATTEALLRCRMGMLDGCTSFVGPENAQPGYFDYFYDAPIDRTPLVTEFPGVLVVTSGTWGAEWTRLRSGMLSTLATQLGPERFGAIWRDPRGFQDAYQAHAGESFAAFVAGQVALHTRPYSAGPSIPALPTALAIAMIISVALLTVARSPRQMI